MYCNKCGKYNPLNSNFCKYCGTKIESSSDTEFSPSLGGQNKHSQDEENNKKKRKKEMNSGLTGWLAILGAGIILGLILRVYSIVEYIPLLSQFENDFPSLNFAIRVEFIFTIVFTILQLLMFLLYLSKSKNFPKYYVYFLTGVIIFFVLDHLYLASMTAPNQDLQFISNDVLDENSNEILRSIVFSTIWSLYLLVSKQVKKTFVN